MIHSALQIQHDHQKTQFRSRKGRPKRAGPHSNIEVVWRKTPKKQHHPNFGVHPSPKRSTRAPRQPVTTFLDGQWPGHRVHARISVSGKCSQRRHDVGGAFSVRENAPGGSSVRSLAFQAPRGRLKLQHFSPRGLVGAVGRRTPRAVGECRGPVSSRSSDRMQGPIKKLFSSLC